MDVDNFNVDSYKLVHESSTEWRLRRAFMLAHYDKYDLNRLLCLASCFVNVECYGCRYPEKLMKQLAALCDGFNEVLEKYRKDIKEKKTQVQFIKSTGEKDRSGNNWRNSSPGTSGGHGRDSPASVDSMVDLTEDPAEPDPAEVAAPAADPPAQTAAQTAGESPAPPAEPPRKRIAQPYGTNIPVVTEPMPQPNIPPKPRYTQLAARVSKGNKTYGQKKLAQVEAAANAAMTAAAPKTVSAVKAVKSYGGSFMTGGQFQSTDIALGGKTGQTEGEPMDDEFALMQKFQALREYVKDAKGKKENSAATIHYASQKAKLKNEVIYKFGVSPLEGKFNVGLLLVNKVIAARAEHRVKKQVKNAVYDLGVVNLTRPYFKIIPSPDMAGYQELICSDKPIPESSGDGKRKRETVDLADFILLDHAVSTMNSVSVIRTSADFNHQKILFEHKTETVSGLLKTKCSLYIGDELFIEGFGNNVISSKYDACERALKHLRKTNWTIKIKGRVDGDGNIDSLRKDDVLGEVKRATCPLPDDNVGRRMLEKLGWAGGGLGKSEAGIKEPIAVEAVINKNGLGMRYQRGVSRDFLPKVRDVLHSYAKSDNPYDFAFAPEFSSEEREIIHAQARRLHLKSRSYGKGDDRYLVISRKRTASQLLTYIVKQLGDVCGQIGGSICL